MTILAAGGGTLGPVTPVIAAFRQIKKRRPEIRLAWVGTPHGPERKVVEEEHIPFLSLPVAKFPRYPSIDWLLWPLRYVAARREASRILDRINPVLVVSAGGFTAVPLIRTAAARGILSAIHQLDVEPGLSNKLVARCAKIITTSFAYTFPPFKGGEYMRVSTPSRFSGMPLPSRHDSARAFDLNPERPIVLVIGGGTGAQALNDAIGDIGEVLRSSTQLIHVTGENKGARFHASAGYVVRAFLDEETLLRAYAAADVVVSRAGIGAIADLACLAKPTIFVPLPNSPQEQNVAALSAFAVREGEYFAKRLLQAIRELLQKEDERLQIADALHDAFPTDDGSALAEQWLKVIDSSETEK